MRLVQLDDDTALDVDRIGIMHQQHYEKPEPGYRTTIYVRGCEAPAYVKGSVAEIMAKIHTIVDLNK